MKHKDSTEESSPFISENEVRGTRVRVWPVVDETAHNPPGVYEALNEELGGFVGLRAAVVSVLGGVGALSPELYEGALCRIGELTGRVVDSEFRTEVRDVLCSLPCPLD